MRPKIDINKLKHLPTTEDMFVDEYGAKGTASRDEFDAKSRAWYYAEVLKKARKAAGITQQQLADKIVAMQAVLERLDMKIDGYEERCLKFEEENLRQ